MNAILDRAASLTSSRPVSHSKVGSMSAVGVLNSGKGWVDVGVVSLIQARYFYDRSIDSIVDPESGKDFTGFWTPSGNKVVPIGRMQSVTHESDVEAVAGFARDKADEAALRELSLDLLRAYMLAHSGNSTVAEEILETWAETVEMEADSELMARVERGLKQAEAGTGRVWKPRTKSN